MVSSARTPGGMAVNSNGLKAMYTACLAALTACGPNPLPGIEDPELAPKFDIAASQLQALADCSSTYSLTKDVAQSNLSGVQGSWSCIYKLTVPSGAGALKFTTSGGTGDADLYVRYNLVPDGTLYDCRSMSGSNADQCSIPSPQAGTYYVRLYGYGAYSGASLTATYATVCSSSTIMDVSRSYLNVNAPQGMFSCGFMFTVPTGVNSVTFTTSGGTGNGDLYVRKLDWPRLDTYDCKSAGYSNNETCTLNYPTPGTYYIKLYGTSESSGAQLIATMDRPYTAPVLVRGQPYVGVSLAAGEQRRYEIDLPWGKSDLKFGVASGPNTGIGSVDYYVKFESVAGPQSYDCKGYNLGPASYCTMGWGKTGRYYLTLVARDRPVPDLTVSVNYTDYYN
ncbi:hypothetical protein F0U60_19095 [Archangium minus]|uniref:Peptidase C-terminal archaeal/bacterial domain-containing protein n=2 Tax=Archangium minus TaxID=83450 RepID=A0ABY9WV61_9BACT|nr:hypothetical protein F0U60_19095 [Archangium minus]